MNMIANHPERIATNDAAWKQRFATESEILAAHVFNGERWILRWERLLGSSGHCTRHGVAYACIRPGEIGWQWAIWSAINELLHRGQNERYDQAVEAILRFFSTINAERMAEGVEA